MNRPLMKRNQPELTKEKIPMSQSWGKILKYCAAYLPYMGIALGLAIAATVLQILSPDFTRELTDVVTNGLPSLKEGVLVIGVIDFDRVNSIMIILAAFFSIAFILSTIQNFLMASLTAKIARKMRKDICDKIDRLPLRYFDNAQTGDVISRVTNDVDTISQTLNQSLPTMVSAICLLVGSVIMMFVTNWILALTAIISSVIGFGLMSVIMMLSRKHFMAQQIGLGTLNGQVEEVYSSHNIVKVYNGKVQVLSEFERVNQGLYDSAWKSQFFSGLMMPLMNFLGNLGYVSVCVIGAILVSRDTITFGVISAFIIYIKLFTQPLGQLAQASQTLLRTSAASKRVFEYLDEPELNPEIPSNHIEKAHGNVEFKNVKFGYLPNKTIIHNFSVKVEKGQKIAIVGPTGAGKTTIVNLLMRFYEPDSGAILLDGKPINTLSRANVHDQFCMVLQDTWLFEGTISENIIFSEKNITQEQVVKACKLTGIHHFIKTLPQGYNTILDDKANLSSGQRQLMTIARAMIKNAPLLILDEATSSVDTRTEVIIQKAMDTLMTGRTSFVIAHRLSTIRNADIILVLRDGDIVESGSHSELLQKNGYYAQLYNSQFEK